jgi:hypothetical protein
LGELTDVRSEGIEYWLRSGAHGSVTGQVWASVGLEVIVKAYDKDPRLTKRLAEIALDGEQPSWLVELAYSGLLEVAKQEPLMVVKQVASVFDDDLEPRLHSIGGQHTLEQAVKLLGEVPVDAAEEVLGRVLPRAKDTWFEKTIGDALGRHCARHRVAEQEA